METENYQLEHLYNKLIKTEETIEVIINRVDIETMSGEFTQVENHFRKVMLKFIDDAYLNGTLNELDGRFEIVNKDNVLVGVWELKDVATVLGYIKAAEYDVFTDDDVIEN